MLLKSSSAHYNSVLTFPNNRFRHTCYCLSSEKAVWTKQQCKQWKQCNARCYLHLPWYFLQLISPKINVYQHTREKGVFFLRVSSLNLLGGLSKWWCKVLLPLKITIILFLHSQSHHHDHNSNSAVVARVISPHLVQLALMWPRSGWTHLSQKIAQKMAEDISKLSNKSSEIAHYRAHY